MQHQVLGSDQWTALVTGLREPRWVATGLRKGAQHIFRVLSTTIKSSSKPSPPSEPVQLLERGEPGASCGVGVRAAGREELGVRGGGSRPGMDTVTMEGVVWLCLTPSHQSGPFSLLEAAGPDKLAVQSCPCCSWLNSLDKLLNLSEPWLPCL